MEHIEQGYRRMPGLYRLWDIPMVVGQTGDWRIHYAELTENGTPLFALYRCTQEEVGHDGD